MQTHTHICTHKHVCTHTATTHSYTHWPTDPPLCGSTHTHTHTHTHTLTLSLSLTLTHAHTHTLSLTHTHTHALSHLASPLSSAVGWVIPCKDAIYTLRDWKKRGGFFLSIFYLYLIFRVQDT